MNSTFHPSGRTHHTWIRDKDGPGLLLEQTPSDFSPGVRRKLETLDEFPAQLERREADLLDIATAVFGTDRMAPRPSACAKASGAHFLDWRRELVVRIPVRDPSFWSINACREALEAVLLELTDDEWHLEFFESEPPCRPAAQLRLLPASDGRPVALFSGGLDSLAGALLFRMQHGHLPWLVSIASNSHIMRQQTDLIHLLRDHFTEMPEHLVFNVHNSGPEPREQAKRQRARSFLYFIIAALVARRVGTADVLILENGVTSLNVPISPILTSTRTTRTTHPLVLMAFQRMIQLVLEWSNFRLIAPYQSATKAEMTSAVSKARTLIAASVSCARVRTGRWCGTCTACLLRRQVLWFAGLDDIDRDECRHYACDIFSSFDDESMDASRRWYFLATLDQVFRILQNPQSLSGEPSLLRVAAAKAERAGSSMEAEMQDLIQLHVRYANEWRTVVKQLSSHYPKLKVFDTALGYQVSP